MGVGNGGQLISVYPEELSFEFELGKPCYCNLNVVNRTEHHIAYKVKTTSPKKYFVRPNAGVVQPWDSCPVTVTLQAQQEYPPDMQCKDKFLIQSTLLPPGAYIDEVPKEAFSGEGDRAIEERKLRVVYKVPGHGDEPGLVSSKWSSGDLSRLNNASTEEVQAIQHLKEERDATLQQNQQLQRELEMLKKRQNRKSDAGFSLTFAAFVGLIGLILGFILNLISSSPPTE